MKVKNMMEAGRLKSRKTTPKPAIETRCGMVVTIITPETGERGEMVTSYADENQDLR